jgi:hypothetical protein
MAVEYRCMWCGHWHEEGSGKLRNHYNKYIKSGGTYTEWEKRDTSLNRIVM